MTTCDIMDISRILKGIARQYRHRKSILSGSSERASEQAADILERMADDQSFHIVLENLGVPWGEDDVGMAYMIEYRRHLIG